MQELPYSCMFCQRPFRHKSGLNSHHKRHIQRGVFNRPISSKDKIVTTDTNTAATMRLLQQQSANLSTGMSDLAKTLILLKMLFFLSLEIFLKLKKKHVGTLWILAII